MVYLQSSVWRYVHYSSKSVVSWNLHPTKYFQGEDSTIEKISMAYSWTNNAVIKSLLHSKDLFTWVPKNNTRLRRFFVSEESETHEILYYLLHYSSSAYSNNSNRNGRGSYTSRLRGTFGQGSRNMEKTRLYGRNYEDCKH